MVLNKHSMKNNGIIRDAGLIGSLVGGGMAVWFHERQSNALVEWTGDYKTQEEAIRAINLFKYKKAGKRVKK